jgi:uncharacterized protein DUF3644
MKARSKQLVDRAIAATVAAIEIYNKPDFQYRNETFAVLAVNGWELLLKAKWLLDHKNDIRSLYVVHTQKKKDGTLSKRAKIKETRSGNPFTHGIEFVAKRLVQQKELDEKLGETLRSCWKSEILRCIFTIDHLHLRYACMKWALRQ